MPYETDLVHDRHPRVSGRMQRSQSGGARYHNAAGGVARYRNVTGGVCTATDSFGEANGGAESGDCEKIRNREARETPPIT